MLNRRTVNCLIVLLSALAIAYWAKGFVYLTVGRHGEGAIDMRLRWIEQQYVLNRQNPGDVFFASYGLGLTDRSLARGRSGAIIKSLGPPGPQGYPPWAFFSGYLLFWLPWSANRIYFAFIQLLCLVWLIRWAYLEARILGQREAALAAAGVAAMAAICTTLGTGQYGILVIGLLGAVLQLETTDRRYTAGLLLGIACLKPSIAGPFLLPFLVKGRWKEIVAAAGYIVAASAVIWWVVRTSPFEMLDQAIVSHRMGAAIAQSGYGPLTIAAWLGMPPQLATPLVAGAALSGALAVLFAFRHRPLLDMFAVCAVCGRFWTYHQTYDNLVLVFLLVALARRLLQSERWSAMLWLAAVGVSLWTPAKITDQLWFQLFQSIVWIGGLAVLLMAAQASANIETTFGQPAME